MDKVCGLQTAVKEKAAGPTKRKERQGFLKKKKEKTKANKPPVGQVFNTKGRKSDCRKGKRESH